ncbi:MAG: phage Gp37/Gp68 family protein [Gemmatimonadota bacterium]
MGERTQIEWTDATWNPTTGCTKVSRGCDNCYAHTLAHGRLSRVYLKGLPVLDTPEAAGDPFAMRLWPDRLKQPAKWADARMIFVNSMSDLFHQDVLEDFLREIFTVMLNVDRHVYQVLTKRPARAQRFYRRNADLFGGGPIPGHIWLGTSVEDQDAAFRVGQLVNVPAETRFLSCEPLLGPLDLELDGVHWVIAGGESGIGYRGMDPSWARAVRDQCLVQGVPFFFKQWGGRTPKAKGRMLDGRTWDELPDALHELTV